MSSDLSRRYEFAKRIAELAADLVRSHFRQGVEVDRKSDASPVTVADRAAEELLRREICDAFPDDGIVGEEFGVTEFCFSIGSRGKASYALAWRVETSAAE